MGRKKIPSGPEQAPASRFAYEHQSAQAPEGPVTRDKWKKGGPSPNPKGRPLKRWRGHVTQKMDRETEVVLGGVPTTITLREALDRLVQQEAREQGGRWLKLWNNRKARDADIQAALADLEQYERAHATGVRIRSRETAGDAVLSIVEKIVPGLIDTIGKLKRSGALVVTDDGWDRESWVSVPPKPPCPRGKSNIVNDA